MENSHLPYKINLLFICSRNQWRSPTAEKLWSRHPNINCRSAGTSSKARRTVSANDINWADVIMVMEGKHKNRLQADFGRLLAYKTLHVLDIPDDYQYMDEALIEELQSIVPPLLNLTD